MSTNGTTSSPQADASTHSATNAPVNAFHLKAIKGQVRRGFIIIALLIVGSDLFWQWRLTHHAGRDLQFILMDPAKTLYLSEAQHLNTSPEFHSAQAIRALEALFDRGPTQVDHPGRLKLLFTRDAHRKAMESLDKDAVHFRERNLHQKVEAQQPEVLFPHGQPVQVHAVIQLIRTGIFHGQVINEVVDLKVHLQFVPNPNMLRNGLAPTVVSDFTITPHTPNS